MIPGAGAGMPGQIFDYKAIRAGGALLAILMLAATASAGVKAGDKITPDNAYQIRDIVSPGVYYMVSHGMSMNITRTKRVDWPPPYKEATEKFSAQVRLSE